MINKNDYKEMEVLNNGEWVKADVLKELEDGTCLYLIGDKTSDGSYQQGGCIPASSFREIKRYETRVKSARDIMKILIGNNYELDIDGDWFDPNHEYINFTRSMWLICGKSLKHNTGGYSFDKIFLEEVEVTA